LNFVGYVSVKVVAGLGARIIKGATCLNFNGSTTLKGDCRFKGVLYNNRANNLGRAVACAVHYIICNLVDAGFIRVNCIASDNYAGREISIHIVICLYPGVGEWHTCLMNDFGGGIHRGFRSWRKR
jgi:hypothetical protein